MHTLGNGMDTMCILSSAATAEHRMQEIGVEDQSGLRGHKTRSVQCSSFRRSAEIGYI